MVFLMGLGLEEGSLSGLAESGMPKGPTVIIMVGFAFDAHPLSFVGHDLELSF
jgi:hypothetical protein